MRKLVLLALRYESGIWKSLYRWVFRRPTAPAGEQPFSYTQAVAPVLWSFLAISAIEIPVLHLLVPWETVCSAPGLMETSKPGRNTSYAGTEEVLR